MLPDIPPLDLPKRPGLAPHAPMSPPFQEDISESHLPHLCNGTTSACPVLVQLERRSKETYGLSRVITSKGLFLSSCQKLQ